MDSSPDERNEIDDFWDSLKNLTEPEYLERLLGPKHLPLSFVLPMTLVYVAIFSTGIFGNVTTCLVIMKNASMQNATNYYLFSLAVSDLILLVLGLPNELSGVWQQYPWTLGVVLCKTRAYVSEMSSYVSVLTIVAFSTERYLAICHPLKFNAMSGSKRSVRIILALWLIAIISALPFAIYVNVNYIEYPPDSGNSSADSAFCAMITPLMPEFPIYELSCLVFFLIPMFILLVLYAQMSLKLRESMKNSLGVDFSNTSVHGESKKIRSRRTVIRMLSAVVLMFFVCWAPFHAQRLIYVYAQDSDYYPDLNEWIYILSGCLYYFSTIVNPILYNLFSSRYREAFGKTLCFSSKRTLKPTRSFFQRNSTKVSYHYRHSLQYTLEQTKPMLNFNESQQGEKSNPLENYIKAENRPFGVFVENFIAKEQNNDRESEISEMSKAASRNGISN